MKITLYISYDETSDDCEKITAEIHTACIEAAEKILNEYRKKKGEANER
jgi:hypothetical protein